MTPRLPDQFPLVSVLLFHALVGYAAGTIVGEFIATVCVIGIVAIILAGIVRVLTPKKKPNVH